MTGLYPHQIWCMQLDSRTAETSFDNIAPGKMGWEIVQSSITQSQTVKYC